MKISNKPKIRKFLTGSSLKNKSTQSQVNFPLSYKKEYIVFRGYSYFIGMKFELNI